MNKDLADHIRALGLARGLSPQRVEELIDANERVYEFLDDDANVGVFIVDGVAIPNSDPSTRS